MTSQPDANHESKSYGALQRWILGGLLFGLLAGLLANYVVGEKGPARDALSAAVREVLQPLGGIFLRLLFMTVVPLVFSCLVLGIHELGDFRQLGKVGLKTLIITLCLSSFSVVLGLCLVNTIQPGKRVDPQVRERLLSEAHGKEAEVKNPAVIAGIGTAGIPGGSLPLIVPVLVSVGVPKEGIIIILGIDRLLDMCRMVLNVTGDIVAAAVISRSEGGLAIPQE